MLICVAFTATAFQAAGAGEQAHAKMKGADGADVGEVSLLDTHHGVLLHAKLKNLPEGAHAFHVHTAGKCEPPFKSAGGHFNPEDRKHGLHGKGRMHAGDMPNIHVPASGSLEIEVLNAQLKLGPALLDEDGTSIVIHAGADQSWSCDRPCGLEQNPPCPTMIPHPDIRATRAG